MSHGSDKPHVRGRSLERFTLAGLLLCICSLVALPFARPSLAAPAGTRATINVGVKNFAEEQIIADMYQLLLQKAGFNVKQHVLGETPALHSALLRGDLDLYPEYTGTGLIVLHYPKIVTNGFRAYDIVKTRYQRKFHITWLLPSPMNDTNDVAVTQATARKYGVHNLSQLAKVGSKFRFADDPACKGRPDCLGGMKRFYGIHFKSVTDITSTPLRYKGLMSGQYDAVEVFTTDAPIRANHLVVLADNKHAVFPADNIAPIVRDPILAKYPKIRTVLNRLSAYITTPAMIRLNGFVILQSRDAMTVARTFLKSKRLL